MNYVYRMLGLSLFLATATAFSQTEEYKSLFGNSDSSAMTSLGNSGPAPASAPSAGSGAPSGDPGFCSEDNSFSNLIKNCSNVASCGYDANACAGSSGNDTLTKSKGDMCWQIKQAEANASPSTGLINGAKVGGVDNINKGQRATGAQEAGANGAAYAGGYADKGIQGVKNGAAYLDRVVGNLSGNLKLAQMANPQTPQLQQQAQKLEDCLQSANLAKQDLGELSKKFGAEKSYIASLQQAYSGAGIQTAALTESMKTVTSVPPGGSAAAPDSGSGWLLPGLIGAGLGAGLTGGIMAATSGGDDKKSSSKKTTAAGTTTTACKATEVVSPTDGSCVSYSTNQGAIANGVSNPTELNQTAPTDTGIKMGTNGLPTGTGTLSSGTSQSQGSDSRTPTGGTSVPVAGSTGAASGLAAASGSSATGGSGRNLAMNGSTSGSAYSSGGRAMAEGSSGGTAGPSSTMSLESLKKRALAACSVNARGGDCTKLSSGLQGSQQGGDFCTQMIKLKQQGKAPSIPMCKTKEMYLSGKIGSAAKTKTLLQ